MKQDQRKLSFLCYHPILLLFVFTLLFTKGVFSQITATTSSTPNTHCNSDGCVNYSYSGPSLLINEIMMSPSTYDGSLWSPTCGGPTSGNGCGEWVELYNPNLCQPVDVSCFRLGYGTTDMYGQNSGGYAIPPGTIVPPGGFLVIRGSNAAAVSAPLLVANGGNTLEIVIDPNDLCVSGMNASRFWLRNDRGDLALYDDSGVPLDAIYWGNAGNAPQWNLDMNVHPCIANPGGCPFSGTLMSYNEIPSSIKYYLPFSVSDNSGYSKHRATDGGAWVNAGALPTMGDCNGVCATLPPGDCTGTVTVSPAGGATPYTFLWNDSQAQTTATATGLCAGSYTVTVTDNNGDSEQFTVTVANYVPPVTFDVEPNVCIDGGLVLLDGAAAPMPGTNETGVFTGTGVSNSTFDPASAGIGIHLLTYTFTNEYGCTNSATDQIEVNPLPAPTITVDTDYCESDPAFVVNVSPTSGTLSGPGVTGDQFSPDLAGVGTHTLTYSYTDANGCSNTTSTTVIVNESPTVMVNSEQICLGQNATLTAVPSTNGGSFSWTPGGQNGSEITVEPPVTSNYTVTYTLNGCSASATGTVTVNNGASATISATNTVIGTGETIQLSAGNADSYLWSSGETTQTISVSPTESTTYCVTVNEGGCVDSTCINITIGCESVVYAPNCITADGDHINDVFIVQTHCLIEYHLFIVNRWGEFIFETWDINDHWDGTYKGKPVSDGVYTYVIIARGGDNKFYDLQGFVTVLR